MTLIGIFRLLTVLRVVIAYFGLNGAAPPPPVTTPPGTTPPVTTPPPVSTPPSTGPGVPKVRPLPAVCVILLTNARSMDNAVDRAGRDRRIALGARVLRRISGIVSVCSMLVCSLV